MRAYDLILGVGNACSCTQILRAAGLQHLSFPFDWVIFNGDSHADLRARADTVAADFKGWFEQPDFTFRGRVDWHPKDIYVNGRTQIIFNHEFAKFAPLDESFAAVRAKYGRRIRRLYACLARARTVLLVRTDRPDQAAPTSEADCRYALDGFRRKFPHARFDLLHLAFREGVAVPQEENLGDGLLRLSFDYKDRRPGAAAYEADISLAASVLASRFAVRDYRTAAERFARRFARLRKLVRGRQKYDLVFGLGNACSCSQSLRRAKLQHLSFPYDWITPEATDSVVPTDLPARADNVCNGFRGWLNEADFQFLCTQGKHDCYYHRPTKFVFNHDFPAGAPLHDAFPAVREKYRRRCERLLDLIRASKRVLVVVLDRPDQKVRSEPENGRLALRKLSAAFPGVRFDLVLMQLEKGRDWRKPRVTDYGLGLTALNFDYANPNPSAPAYEPDFRKTAAVLRKRYAVRDYRTLRERFSRLLSRAHGKRPVPTVFDRKYEAVCSVGLDCTPATYLKALGLRNRSMPFDWLMMSDFSRRARLILDGFKGLLSPENVRPCPERPSNTGHLSQIDCATGLVFLHDFDPGVDRGQMLETVRARYARRTARFLDLLHSGTDTLLVHFERDWERTPASSFAKFLDDLRGEYPSARVSLLVLKDSRDGFAEISPRPDLTIVSADLYPPGVEFPGERRQFRRVLSRIRVRGPLATFRMRLRAGRALIWALTRLVPLGEARRRARKSLCDKFSIPLPL